MEEIIYLLRVAYVIDKMYAKSNKKTYYYLKKFRKIVDKFNKKYPLLLVAIDKSSLNIKLKFFIKRQSVDEINKELKFKTKDVVVPRSNIDHAYFKGVTDSLTIEKDPNRNMVELIYRSDTLNNHYSPEFKLLTWYAFLEQDNSIDIKEEIDDIFCFDLDDDEGHGVVYTTRKFKSETHY